MTPPIVEHPLLAAGAIGDVSVAFVIAMAGLAFAAAAAVSVIYRLVMETPVPWHLPLIVGLGVVGLWTNTASTIVEFIERSAAQEPLLLQEMETYTVAVLASALAALLGGRFADRATPGLAVVAGRRPGDARVGRVVRAIGRFIAVDLPPAEDVHDLEGYEPVAAEVRDRLDEATLVFPRGLTVEELHRRVVDRLRADYGIGAVDLDLDDDGAVAYLALGGREAGIGPTLPARRGAINLRTTPAPQATPGDRVDVWRVEDDGAMRVAAAELRSAGDDHATVVMDVRRLRELDQRRSFELVTRRADPRPDLEFASLLRSANETLGTVTVGAGSALDGLPVGGLRLPVVAIQAGDDLETVPDRFRALASGDTLYVMGRPDELRRVRRAAAESGGGRVGGAPRT